MLERLGRSAVLAGLALGVGVPLAVGLGVLSAVRRGGLVDHAVGLVSLVAVSLPEFIIGTALILVLAFRFPLLPPSSLIDPQASLWHAAPSLVLPVLTLVLALLAHMTRMTRASMLEVLEQPYVRAARLRGLRPRRVILRHALRNALLPTVGIIAINVGYLIGGIVVVETVFAYPGLGRLMVDAVNHRDVPVIQMTALVIGAHVRARQPGGRPGLRVPEPADPVLTRWAASAVRRWTTFARRVLLGSPAAAVGTALLATHVGLAVFGPALAPHHFAQFDILHTLEPPSRGFWGGTDQFGRDQLSRVMWGARGDAPPGHRQHGPRRRARRRRRHGGRASTGGSWTRS